MVKELMAQWIETTMYIRLLLPRFSLKEVAFEKNGTGGNHGKVSLTGMVACSLTGETSPMFVVGKTKTPRSFKKYSLPLSSITNKLDVVVII